MTTKRIILVDTLALLTNAYILKVKNVTIRMMLYGSYEELEVATYLYDTLEYTIEKAYKELIKKNPYLDHGISSKNGFYFGIFKAIEEKISVKNDNSLALMKVKSEVEEIVKELYSHMGRIKRSKGSSFKSDPNAFSKGKEYGKSMEIKKEPEQLLLEF